MTAFGGSGYQGGQGQPNVGAQFNTSFGVGGSATGSSLILIGLLGILVLHYVWSRPVQGGR